MKWFTGVFLPSLEEKYRTRNGKVWLTAKQVGVCSRYMIPTETRGVWELSVENKVYAIAIAPNGCAKLHIFVDGWQMT